MTQLTESDALKLLDDRVKFKVYVAEQELSNLKELEKNGWGISSAAVPRVMWEMKIECLLAQLVGAVDALLIRINDKLGLGLKDFQVNSSPTRMKEINQRLNSLGKSNLLIPLNDAQDPGENTKNPPKDPGWLWILKDLRNQGMHRKLINIHTVASIHEHINTAKSWSDKNRVYLIMNPQTTLEIIPYLEDSIMKTRDLAATIIGSEPLLKI